MRMVKRDWKVVALQNAMRQMISLLDSARHLLEELSPELGVTDPVSGSVVFEKLA